jgi:WW domain-binding protein 11
MLFLIQVDDLQKRMLAMAGQDVDAYLKEMEEVHRQTQAEKAAQFQSRMEALQQQQQPSERPRRFGAMPPGPPPGPPPAFGVKVFA